MKYHRFSQYLDIASYCCIALISVVLVIILVSSIIKHQKQKKEILLKRAPKPEAHGVIFGKKGRKVVFRPEDSQGHVLCCASTGKGKTSAALIPTLKTWQGTSYNIDISGDITTNCNTPHKLVYSPESPDTAPYNIFGPIDDLETIQAKNEALTKLSILLMPKEKNPSSASLYFYEHGLKILKAALIAFYDKMDFIEIVDEIVNNDYKTLFHKIDQTENQVAIALINCFQSISEQNVSGAKQSCDNALELYATNHSVRQSIRRPKEKELALEPKHLENHNIFFIVSEPALDILAPLMNIVTSQVMQYISAREITPESKQILVSLDEFRSLKLDVSLIMGAVERFRKRRTTIFCLLQNIASLDYLYGNEGARTILSNFDYVLLLGGLNDPASRQHFADLIGYRRYKKISTSKNNTSTTTTQSWELKYCIEPADLDKQGKNTAILISNELKNGYMKLKKNFYFKK